MEKSQFDFLARFNKFILNKEEEHQLQQALDKELELLVPLGQLDTSGVEPMVFSVPMRQMFREDKAEKTISREQILAIAPEVSEGSYLVPRVAD